jgi:hypothetical protein
MKIQIKQNIKAVIVGLLVVVGVGYASAAWNPAPSTGPQNAATNNADAPINVGLNHQEKLGQLFINTDTNNPYAVGLSVFGKTILNGAVQITSGTPGKDKVLMDTDGTGNVGWGTVSSGGSGLDSLCTTVDTGAAFVGWKEVNLLLGSKNMCSDLNGCSYRIWRYDNSNPEGTNLFGNNSYLIRQTSTGKWIDSQGNNSGVNGNSMQDDLIGSWDGVAIFSDDSSVEHSPDKLSIKDTSSSQSVVVTMCDF